MKFLKLSAPLVFAIFISLFFASCDVSDTSSQGPGKVAVTMNLQSSTHAKLKGNNSLTTQSVDSLTEVKFLIEELELESAVDEDSLDFEHENIIANLPLDGSSFVLSSETVPEGIYDEFELEIEHDDTSVGSDPDFEQDGTYYSLVIKGIYNGEKFTYRSEEDFEIELELNPPLEITESDSSFSININIDPSNWFTSPETGKDLDPNNPDHKEQIDENIKKSFEAHSEKEDHDEEGDDRDHEDDDEGGDDD